MVFTKLFQTFSILSTAIVYASCSEIESDNSIKERSEIYDGKPNSLAEHARKQTSECY